MDSEQAFEMLVHVGLESGDNEEIDLLTRELRSELLEMDVDSVNLVPAEAAPQGSKVIDPVLLGVLAVGVGPIVLTKVLEFLHAWAMRREGRVVKIRIQAGPDSSLEVEVPAIMPRSEVKTWINTVSEALNEKRKKAGNRK